MNRKIIIFILTFMFINGGLCFSSPNISSYNKLGNVITIKGVGFGIKTNASPIIYDDFESGSIDSNNWNNPYGMEITSSRQRGISNYCVRGDFYNSWAAGSLVQNNFSDMPGYGGKIYISIWFQCGDNWNWDEDVWSNGFKWMRIKDPDNSDEFAYSFITNAGYLSPNNGNPDYNIGGGWSPKNNMSINKWYHFEFIIKTPSVNHLSTDATAKMYVNSDHKSNLDLLESHNLTWFGTDTDDTIDTLRIYRMWHTNSGTPSQGSYLYIDDIYIDNTWARVELGDNPNYNECTHTEIQIPTQWSDTQITVTYNQGSFKDYEQTYLFVIDKDGNVSNGYPLDMNWHRRAEVRNLDWGSAGKLVIR